MMPKMFLTCVTVLMLAVTWFLGLGASSVRGPSSVLRPGCASIQCKIPA
jgi:hypothetical protein